LSPSAEVRALLGLGSNLGDRLATLQSAVDRLEACEGIRVRRSSRVYETDPVGPPQPDYLNAVVEVMTTLGARELLDACLAVEASLGRVRAERWGPRTIDIDLLNYGREEIAEPGLTVPHPRMHERAFVLLPLLEVDADPLLPGGRSIGTLRLGAMALGGAAPFAPALSVTGARTPS
jgi:2-amino-4-hydroxy-6-hydroxymethyldihydropteridine diphosphokinase